MSHSYLSVKPLLLILGVSEYMGYIILARLDIRRREEQGGGGQSREEGLGIGLWGW